MPRMGLRHVEHGTWVGNKRLVGWRHWVGWIEDGKEAKNINQRKWNEFGSHAKVQS